MHSTWYDHLPCAELRFSPFGGRGLQGVEIANEAEWGGNAEGRAKYHVGEEPDGRARHGLEESQGSRGREPGTGRVPVPS